MSRERGLVSLRTEVAVRPSERADLTDFAVHQVFAGPQSLLLGVFRYHSPIDHLVESGFQTALCDEFLHGQGGVLLAGALQRRAGRTGQHGLRDFRFTHYRGIVPAGEALSPPGRVGDVGTREGERDQRQKGEGKYQPELGLEDVPKETEHKGRWTR